MPPKRRTGNLHIWPPRRHLWHCGIMHQHTPSESNILTRTEDPADTSEIWENDVGVETHILCAFDHILMVTKNDVVFSSGNKTCVLELLSINTTSYKTKQQSRYE